MKVEIWNSSETRFYIQLPDRTIDRSLEPYALIYAEKPELAGIDSLELRLRSRAGELLFEGTAPLEDEAGYQMARFPFPGMLPERPAQAEVKGSDQAEPQVVDIELVRLWGRFEDFDGRPLSGGLLPLVKIRPFGSGYDVGMWRTGDDGWYECHVPKGLYRQNHALLESYCRTTLENYFYELHLAEDTRLDFRIGELEVAKLAATPVDGDGMFCVRFICWSIHDTCQPYYAALERGESAALNEARFIPRLAREEIRLLIDGEPAEIVSFDAVAVQNMRREVTPGWHVEALLPDGLGRGTHRLDVVVSHSTRDADGKDVLERGQGILFQLLHP